MDSSLNAGGIAGIVSLVIVITRELYKAINHRRIRSKCCDKEISASIDIEATTPPTKPTPTAPAPNSPPLELRIPDESK